jgi:hypothetical protein
MRTASDIASLILSSFDAVYIRWAGFFQLDIFLSKESDGYKQAPLNTRRIEYPKRVGAACTCSLTINTGRGDDVSRWNWKSSTTFRQSYIAE